MCASWSTRARTYPSVLPARPLQLAPLALVKTRVTARRKRHALPCASTRVSLKCCSSFFTTAVATLNPPFPNRVSTLQLFCLCRRLMRSSLLTPSSLTSRILGHLFYNTINSVEATRCRVNRATHWADRQALSFPSRSDEAITHLTGSQQPAPLLKPKIFSSHSSSPIRISCLRIFRNESFELLEIRDAHDIHCGTRVHSRANTWVLTRGHWTRPSRPVCLSAHLRSTYSINRKRNVHARFLVAAVEPGGLKRVIISRKKLWSLMVSEFDSAETPWS